jgi:hypothetical protein
MTRLGVQPRSITTNLLRLWCSFRLDANTGSGSSEISYLGVYLPALQLLRRSDKDMNAQRLNPIDDSPVGPDIDPSVPAGA